MKISIQNILAKSISYSNQVRDKAAVVEYIVIHNTGNIGDNAYNNGIYFRDRNTRQAGAHFFVDRGGAIIKSIPMNRTAWAVGGDKYTGTKGAKYFGKCTNYNSVSIELCDIVDKDPSPVQIAAVNELIKYIQKYCPKAKTVIRHYDVTGKNCPARFVDTKKWNTLKKELIK